MDLNKKNIILTGASSGIGLELLKRLLRYDVNIIAVARKIESVEIDDPKLIKYPADMGVKENIDKLFEFALEKLGSIDVYIANAGFAYYEIIEKPDWEHIEKIFKLNCFSTFYSAEKMKEINKGRPFRVAVTASAMAFWSLPGYTLYSSSKAAIRGFADAYRYELGRNQKFQVIYPIGTRTNFFKEAGGSPIPFPSQSVQSVARSIIRGLKWNCNSVYPSKLFLFLFTVNKFFPLLGKLAKYIELVKLNNWLKKQGI